MVKQWPIKTMQQYTKVLVLLSVVLPVLDASKSIDASGATCDDITCCPGRVCDDSNGRPRCNMATSCADVDCPDGLRCVEGQRPQSDDDSKRRRKRSNSDSDSNSDDESAAVCLPVCTERVCPFGLVCEERGTSLICRLPTSCDELICPKGTVCEETECSNPFNVEFRRRRRRHRSESSDSDSDSDTTGGEAQIIVRCVAISSTMATPSSTTMEISTTSVITSTSTAIMASPTPSREPPPPDYIYVFSNYKKPAGGPIVDYTTDDEDTPTTPPTDDDNTAIARQTGGAANLVPTVVGVVTCVAAVLLVSHMIVT